MINMEFSDNELDVIYDSLQEMLNSTDDDDLIDTILAIQNRIYESTKA
jgi:hypothetical protein